VNDLLLRALRGEATERRPLWIMRQAGRYLPEYRVMRERFTFKELCARPDLAADVTMMPIERFPLDAAIIFADIMTPLAALGIDVEFAPGPVVARPLRTAADIDALRNPGRGEIAPAVIETVRTVKERLDGSLPVLGFCGGPWTMAAYLVQGEGKRGFPALRALAAADPMLLERLLGRLTDLAAGYLEEQIAAGVDAIQVFETWSGLLSLRDWSHLVKPHLQELLDRVGETGAPRLLFLQDAPHLVGGALDLPVEGHSVDWRVDLASLRQAVGAHRALQGNLDPAVLLAGPELTRRAADALLRRVPHQGHIVNLGHGILPDTPIASVEALIAAVHEEVPAGGGQPASAATIATSSGKATP
jgi:uroporphyrinogen decarboxylase